jgi:hypothetical protein
MMYLSVHQIRWNDGFFCHSGVFEPAEGFYKLKVVGISFLVEFDWYQNGKRGHDPLNTWLQTTRRRPSGGTYFQTLDGRLVFRFY